MALHHVYVSPRQVLSVRVAGVGRTLTGCFDRLPGQALDLSGFTRLLEVHRGDRFVVIADQSDEEQHIESLPRVGGRDGIRLIARRLGQRYSDRPLRVARSLTPAWRVKPVVPADPEGRRPVLLLALGVESGLQAWLGAMKASGVRIAGVYSPALLTEAAMARLGRGLSGLLISVQPGGIRQTLLVDGRVRFSRLAVCDPRTVEGGTIGAECSGTLRYLSTNGMLPPSLLRSGVVRVWCVVDGLVDPQGLPDSIAVDAQHRLPIVAIPAARLGAPRLPADAAAAFVGAAPWLDPRLIRLGDPGFADAPLRAADRLAWWRRRLLTGGGVAFAASAIVWAAVRGVALSGDASTDTENLRRLNDDRRQFEASLPVPGVGGRAMREVVETADRLAARHIDPVTVLQGIARGLGGDPAVRLVSLAWRRSGGGDGATAAGAALPSAMPGLAVPSALPPMNGAGAGMPPVGLAVATGAQVPAASVDEPPVVTIQAEIRDASSRVGANRSARGFADRLRAACGCVVRIASLPFDGSVGAAGAPSSLGAVANRAPFTLTLILDRPGGNAPAGVVDANRQ